MMLRALSVLSIEAVSAIIALVIFAVLGFSIGTLIGAVLAYFGVRAIMRSWVLSEPLPPPMLVFLFILTLFGLIGGIQFIVLASVIVAVFLLKEVKLTRPTIDGILESFKMGLLGLVMPIIGVLLPLVPFYEAARKVRYDVLGALALLALTALAVVAMWLGGVPLSVSLVSVGGVFNEHLGLLGLSESNPLVWVGVIAYEEFIGRVTSFANAMFTLLHMPSRLAFFGKTAGDLGAVALTFMVLLSINYGARWLYSIYQNHGIVASIVGHAMYNAGVSAFADLLSFDLLPAAVIMFLGIAGFLYSLGGRGHG